MNIASFEEIGELLIACAGHSDAMLGTIAQAGLVQLTPLGKQVLAGMVKVQEELDNGELQVDEDGEVYRPIASLDA